jgi:DNA-binding MarR family transcriptional regulator
MEELTKIKRLYPHLVGAMSRLRGILQEGMDLSYNQYKTLLTIANAGECSLNGLSTSLGVAPSSASQMIDRLEKSGLVERRADGLDRRSVTIRVTARGKALLDRIQDGVLENYRRVLEDLPPGDRRRLVRALEDLVDTVGRTEGRENERKENV